jgi:hypothetical protein
MKATAAMNSATTASAAADLRDMARPVERAEVRAVLAEPVGVQAQA